jgi:hypothetical protein
MSSINRPGRSTWRVCAALWCAVTAPVAVLTLVVGALWLGLEGLLVLGVVAGIPVVVYLCVRAESRDEAPSDVRAVHVLAGAGAVIALVGTLELFGGLGLLLDVLLAGAGVLLARWRRCLPRPAAPLVVEQPPLPAELVRPVPRVARRGPHGHRQTRHAMPAGGPDVIRLCAVWRSSYTALQHCTDPARRAALVASREECLAGLERCAPEAFRRWLETVPGAADVPTEFFTRHTSGRSDEAR